MHTESLNHWQHDHNFDQDKVRAGENRTWAVIALTSAMMAVEIVAGIWSGSMALLADGLHMASHTAALTITAGAYVYARRHATDSRFAFGTGKVNALAGFTGAILLFMFALVMAWESIDRLANPVAIAFSEAIFVAVLGLIVNGVSALLLDVHDEHSHHDHNLRSARLHVLADALTSVLAVFALLSAKFLGLNWMDPAMGLVGAALVARWSWSLLRDTSRVLLDHQAPERLRSAIRGALEAEEGDRVADLHIWSIAPGRYAGIVSVVTHEPRAPEFYKKLLPEGNGLAHVSVEVHHCQTRSPGTNPAGHHETPQGTSAGTARHGHTSGG